MSGRRTAHESQGNVVLRKGYGALMKLLEVPEKSSSDLGHVRGGGAVEHRGSTR